MDRAYGPDPGESLHRVMKLALDTGEVASLADAERLFAGYRLTIAIGPDVAASATLQAALLTAVNAGRRCFLGGVVVIGELAVPLRVPWRHHARRGGHRSRRFGRDRHRRGDTPDRDRRRAGW